MFMPFLQFHANQVIIYPLCHNTTQHNTLPTQANIINRKIPSPPAPQYGNYLWICDTLPYEFHPSVSYSATHTSTFRAIAMLLNLFSSLPKASQQTHSIKFLPSKFCMHLLLPTSVKHVKPIVIGQKPNRVVTHMQFVSSLLSIQTYRPTITVSV
jgi:hypothetical protein